MKNEQLDLLKRIYFNLENNNLKKELNNLIDDMEKQKKYHSKATIEYHKRNKEKHRITNNICMAKKRNNLKLVEKWENELKRYMEDRRK